MIKAVATRQYIAKTPAWLRNLKKEDEDDPSGDDVFSGGKGGERGTKRKFKGNGGSGKERRVANKFVCPECKLKPNEQFRDIFHPGNTRSLTKATFKNGTLVCPRFHALGFCFTDCKNVAGHGKMDDEEKAGFVTYTEGARAARASYEGNRQGRRQNNNNNSSEPTNNTTNGARG